MSSTIRNLTVKIGADLTEAQKGFNKLSKEMKTVGKSLTTTGKALTNSITVPAIGAVAGLAALTVKSAAAADELSTLSKETGLSTKTLQELSYASQELDFDVSAVAKGMAKLTAAIGSAKKSGKDYIDVADGVSVAVKDASGNMLSQEEIFYNTIDAIGSLSNETDKEIAAQKLFGRSFQDLNPLIKAGSSELKRLAAEANKAGAIISDTDINALSDLNDTIGEMKQVLTAAAAQIAKAFMPVLESLKPVITTYIIPAIQKFAEWLGNLFKWFSELSPGMQKFVLLITGLVVAIGPLLTISGKVITAFSGIAKAAGAAVAAFAEQGIAGAIKAFMGPAGIATAVIAALTLVVGGLAIALSNTDEEAKALKKDVKDLSGNIIQSAESFGDLMTKTEGSASAAQKLTDELYALQDKEAKSNDEKIRMRDIVEQLNEMYSDLNLSIDDTTYKLSVEKDTINSLIGSELKRIKLSAYSDRLTELYEEQYKITKSLSAVIDKMTFHQKNQVDTLQKTELATRVYNDTLDGTIDNVMDAARYSQKLTAILGKDLATAYYGATIETLRNTAAITEAESAYGDLSDQVTLYSDEISELPETTETAAEETTSYYEKMVDKVRGIMGDYIDIMTDATTTEIKQNDLSVQDWEDSLQEKADQLIKWSAGMESLAGRLPHAMLQQLYDMGPEYSALIQELADMSDADLQSVIQVWADAGSAATQAAKSGLRIDQLSNEAYAAGQAVGLGFSNGVESMIGAVKNASDKIAQTANNAIKSTLKIHSPSKVTREFGQNTSLGFSLGIIDKAREVFKSAGSIARGVVGAFSGQPDYAVSGYGSMTRSQLSSSVSDSGSSAIKNSLSIQGGTVEVPVYLDGREIAKVTAPYMDKALGSIKTNTARGAGL